MWHPTTQVSGVLFIHIQNAFYRLVRRHMTATPGDPRSAHELFQNLDLPEESCDAFLMQLLAKSALEEANTSLLKKGLFSEFYRKTGMDSDEER